MNTEMTKSHRIIPKNGRPTVQFNEIATVIFIDFSQMREHADLLWYTTDEMARFQRLNAKMLNCLDFYTDDQLFVSFGLHSRSNIAKRKERKRRIHYCVNLMEQKGCTWRPTLKQEGGIAAKLYDKESRASIRDAIERAKKVQLQVIAQSQSNNKRL
jgi:hypothetical protein